MPAPDIAIVGLACRYPDARTPAALWEAALASRRSFRRIPAERLPLDDYGCEARDVPDRTYGVYAAVLEGYHFDRVRFQVSAETYRATDLSHWLALDVAADALRDAGFEDGRDLPRERTAVLIGNTLTGEFSRASSLRLRWPYVRRVIEAVLRDEGESMERRALLWPRLEAAFKAPFAPVGSDTLAGGLSNTIAGRICNHFDLHGGGFTVDGACASSLLAVAHACSALAAGDLDVALAGGVDLSLDPFELVGFAKAGALARDAMRVYDAQPTGFWPGEGCGMAVLMRRDHAIARGCRVYAVVRGWGISSDGSGGLTRPEIRGQLLAIDRAYVRAGYGIETLGYVEGHGTGTAVGDATELAALTEARRRRRVEAPRLAIGSIKANIGHTKAAAGMAGLIKAAFAIHTQLLPPTSGCHTPHPLLADPDAALRVVDDPMPWPDGVPLRAGVSSMGFGGINVHVTMESAALPSRRTLSSWERACARTRQDVELFPIEDESVPELSARLDRLGDLASRLSLAELADLAVCLQRSSRVGAIRAAVLADSPAELASQLRRASALVQSEATVIDAEAGMFVGHGRARPRLGFLFTGQGAPVRTTGGAWSRRFDRFADLLDASPRPSGAADDTAVAQPAIVTASIGAWRVLDTIGLRADVAIGHSLGELAALAWAGVFTDDAAIALACARGEAMARLAGGPGAMVALRASASEITPLLEDTTAVVAALNAPDQIVIAGPRDAVEEIAARAERRRIAASRLPVAYAFHSPLMAPVLDTWRRVLGSISPRPPERRIVSTIAGRELRADDDVRLLLERQLVDPVRFAEAMAAAGPVDLWVEVGPGRSLTGLASACGASRAIAVDAGAASLRGLLAAAGAAFAGGVDVDLPALAAGRFARPIDPERALEFLVNPCELVTRAAATTLADADASVSEIAPSRSPDVTDDRDNGDTCGLLIGVVAAHAGLPRASVRADSRFLRDLHLNSIAVSELVQEAARRIGLAPLTSPTDYADATIEATARALDELKDTGSTAVATAVPAGLATWVRTFTIGWRAVPMLAPRSSARAGPWRLVAPSGHPLRDALGRLCADGRGGPGTIVCLDADDARAAAPLLSAIQATLRDREARVVIVQQEEVATGFARTLFMEAAPIDVAVVTLPFDLPGAADRVYDEACTIRGFHHVRYDEDGRRLEPILESLSLPRRAEIPLGSDDLLLVTGGGKGIGAECALALARRTGVRLVLLGRTVPAADATVAANLARLRAAGARVEYVPVDVRDARSVRRALESLRATHGEITAVLHAAGTNEPALIPALDGPTMEDAARAKVDGLRHVLDAIDLSKLRLLVSFGSVIARVGLPGEAHYAYTNARLRLLTERVAASLPHCCALTIEWSVWATVGMGERLGRLDALQRRGITAIDVDRGVDLLARVLDPSVGARSVIAAGRLGDVPPIPIAGGELPFHRFLEMPRVHYPGVELVADAEVSIRSDPYLEDHQLDGELLFPAVMGLEAMTRAAMAVVGTSDLPVIEQVEFERPIVARRDGAIVLRTLALAVADDELHVALRSSATAFQVDHFRAVCRWGASARTAGVLDDAATPPEMHAARELYGPLFFQTGRFARVRGYRHLRATACHAEIDGGEHAWFAPYLPGAFALGDPGTRDAALHGVQACIPQGRVVPIAVARLHVMRLTDGPCRVRAEQRAQQGDELTWDLEIRDRSDALIEVWQGVRLRVIARLEPRPTPVVLLGPYVERRLADLGHRVPTRVVLRRDATGVRDGRAALACLFGSVAEVHRRPDGRPEMPADAISVAHAGPLTLAVTAKAPVGCDLEPVNTRPPDAWRGLLGHDGAALGRLIADERAEPPTASATRVWAALECLKKAGAVSGAPLCLDRTYADGWVTLRADGYRVSTWIADVPGEARVALAIGTKERHAGV